MANIDFGSGPNTPTGDTVRAALIKLQARIDALASAPPAAAPSVSVNDVTVNENNGTLVFTVTRSGNLASASTVNYTTANGTATAGADYTATSGTLTFAANETTKQVAVTILDDSSVEGSESVLLNLSGGSNVTISDAQGVGSITDNDVAAPTGVPGIIMSADFESDHDDLAMAGVCVGLHRQNKVNILAWVSDCRVPTAPAAMRKILDYSNLSNIPVGAWKGNTGGTGSSWAPTVANFGGASDLAIADFADSTAVIRQALVDAPTNDNILMTGGSASTIAAFLTSPADSISPLTGAQLRDAKVSRIVFMGASDSSTPINFSYNIGHDKPAFDTMLANLGAKPFWFGAEDTATVVCGPELTDDPVLNIYRAGFAVATDSVNAQGKRTAYDPTTLHFAVLGPESAEYNVRRGTLTPNSGNSGTSWVSSADGPHYALDLAVAPSVVGGQLDALIVAAYTGPYAVAAPTVRTPTVSGSDITFDFDKVNGATGYEYQLDGGAWAALSFKTKKISGVAAGAHTARIRGTRPGPTPGTASTVINFTVTQASATLATMYDTADGVWLDINPAYLFSDRAGTVPATVGGIVNFIQDRSGSGNHAIAISDTDGYTLREPTTGKYRLESTTAKKGYVISGPGTDFAQVAFVMRFQQKTATNWQTPILKPHALGSHSSPFQRWGMATLNGQQLSCASDGVAISVPTVAGQFTTNHTWAVDAQSAVVLRSGTQVGNGTDDTTQSYPTAGVPLRIGTNGGAAEAFDGYLEGLVLINRSFTSAELALATADVEQA